MTAEVKDELSRLVVNSVSARRAEVAALLRFAGGLHIVAGRVVVEAEVDLGIIARRLRKDIFDLYGYNAVVHVLSASGIRKSTRYVVRVAQDGEALARQTGLRYLTLCCPAPHGDPAGSHRRHADTHLHG